MRRRQQCTLTMFLTAVHAGLLRFRNIQCVQKKIRPNVFCVISCNKLGQFWWNLVHRFANKFAAKSCKRFPPHLNSVSTLPCETWNAHRTRVTTELLQKEIPEFIPPYLRPPNSPDLNTFDYSLWGILQEKVYVTNLKVSCSGRSAVNESFFHPIHS